MTECSALWVVGLALLIAATVIVGIFVLVPALEVLGRWVELKVAIWTGERKG